MIWIHVVDGITGTTGRTRCPEGLCVHELFERRHPEHMGRMMFLLNGAWAWPGISVEAGDNVAWLPVGPKEKCPTCGATSAHWSRKAGA